MSTSNDGKSAEPLAVPTIHMNGTGKRDLRDDLSEACRALSAAARVMQNGAPNSRDYYPQGPGAFAIAQAQHFARLKRVHAVEAELVAIWEEIDEKFPDKR